MTRRRIGSAAHIALLGRGNQTRMEADEEKSGTKMARGSSRNSSRKAASPGWASGLKQLYNSVLDEPLPDSFKDLITKLDNKGA